MNAQTRLPLNATRLAVILAIAGPLVWTIYGLLLPPGMFSDPGYGFMTWNSLLQGAPFDHLLEPDPANIARDVAISYGWWSAGQYLLPALITVTGLRLGTAIVIAVGLCLVIELLGWLRLLRYFNFSPSACLLMVALIVMARYSTLNFRNYIGGEPWITAAAPWIMLWACRIPSASLVRSFVLGALTVFVAFLAKLSGLIVAGAALVAGSLIVLFNLRRITSGMIGGAIGAGAALVFLQIAWFSHQTIHHYAYEGTGNAFTPVHALYIFLAPLTAGLSVHELLAYIFQHPSRRILETNVLILTCILPVAAAIAGFLVYNRRSLLPLPKFVSFAAVFLVIFSGMMLFLYLRNAPIPIEERHYRPSGMLVLAALVAVAVGDYAPRLARAAVFSVLAFASLYGLASLLYRPAGETSARVDAYSRTRIDIIDPQSVRALQDAFAAHGRNALFVLPSSTIAVVLPPNARIKATDLDYTSEAEFVRSPYAGKTAGPIYVVVQNSLVGSGKQEALLRSFTAYDPKAWQARRFAEATIFEQTRP